ncbi:Trp biosynthesis-associated membrane protein [Nocardioides carbamazepini]|uniref:Trp biosynthesis-associated membrane protein n=1 Tax=Nocardioides carbamazepini TaxID=2854259 RepID=UPI00214A4C0B|nr:Trp biosynthesis-associated membrane protein [Nocardioides carbamazepini]MCR1781585.1 Trp biosynthesis-associated membrane protein [Nocardioides carbamazepini]
MTSMTEARATFGPVVLLGLAASGFAAVAGHKEMLSIPEATVTAAGGLAPSVQERSVEFPLAGALALVALAAWGVLLVTRGVVRRVAAALALLASAGISVVVVVGGFAQDQDATADLATRLGLNLEAVDVERTVWLWVALGCSLLALVAAGAAVRLVPAWPEMGSRYDAPTSGPGTGGPEIAPPTDQDPAEQSNLDLWKSLDEGHDPTDDRTDGPAAGPTAG